MIANSSDTAGSDGSAESEEVDGGSTAAVETVLQNDRRRDVLAYLSAQGGEATLASLALYLAADGDETLSAIIEELHDCHVPKLAGHDLLRYERSGVVALLIEPEHADALVARAGDGTG